MRRIATLLVMLPLLLAACARRYRVAGLVVNVNHSKAMMTVSHDPIPGYMEAMVMPFQVRPRSELRSVNPGDRIEFRLVVRQRTSFAERIRSVVKAELANVRPGEAPLPLPIPGGKLALGMAVPDFQLVNHSAQAVRLSAFAGQVVAVNFIYTRCPLPEVCPRLSAHFSHLQNRFRERMGKDLILLSITLDPQHDTPPVLAEYAKRWGAAAGWYFLTGDSVVIRDLAHRFGLVFWAEEGLLTHTSQTALVGRDGRLAALVEGSSYEAVQLGDLVSRQLEVHHDSYSRALVTAR